MATGISKGVRAFGIYFVVYSCFMFLGRGASLLSQIILNKVGSGGSLRCLSPIEYTYFTAIVDFTGLMLSVVVFFAALRILKVSALAVKSVRFICILGIVFNISAIAKDVHILMTQAKTVGVYGPWMAYGMMTCILSIGFWCFVFYFFNREKIKNQFIQSFGTLPGGAA